MVYAPVTATTMSAPVQNGTPTARNTTAPAKMVTEILVSTYARMLTVARYHRAPAE